MVNWYMWSMIIGFLQPLWIACPSSLRTWRWTIMIQGSRYWDIYFSFHAFGEDLACKVLFVAIPILNTAAKTGWCTTASTGIKARDFYRLLWVGPFASLDISWVSKVGTHLRNALYLWKVAWNWLICHSILHYRGFEIASYCDCCLEVKETVSHTIPIPKSHVSGGVQPYLLVLSALSIPGLFCANLERERCTTKGMGMILHFMLTLHIIYGW